MFNKKHLKVVLLGAMSLLTLSACSAKEKANYEPYKKHESVENAQREEGTSNSDKGEKIDEEPAKDEELQQVEKRQKKIRRLTTGVHIIKMRIMMHQPCR